MGDRRAADGFKDGPQSTTGFAETYDGKLQK